MPRTSPSAPNRPLRRLLVAALALPLTLLAAAPPAPAQSEDLIAGVPFADVPYRVRSLGLSMRLPLGASIDTTNIAGAETAVTVSAEDNAWLLRVMGPRISDPELTPAGLAERMIENLVDPSASQREIGGMKLRAASGRAQVLEHTDNLDVPAGEASRFYVAATLPDDKQVVSGYTIFRLSPAQMLVFEISCLRPEFDKVRRVYEAIIATAEIRDPAEVAAERADAVQTGEALLSSVSAEDVDEMLPIGPEWRRLYRPTSTGRDFDADEVAYQSVEIRKGVRGEINTRRSKRSWTAADRDEGWVATVRARYVQTDQTVDFLSRYFLKRDRTQEAWSVQMRIQDRFESVNWTETGIRAAGQIKVSIAQPDGTVLDKSWPTPPEGYLSQVEALLLPWLLARDETSTEYAFYKYNTQRGELKLRRDALEPQAEGDGWVLTTRQHEDAPEEVSTLESDGDLVRQELPDGVVVKPIEKNDLLRLWQRKELPIK